MLEKHDYGSAWDLGWDGKPFHVRACPLVSVERARRNSREAGLIHLLRRHKHEVQAVVDRVCQCASPDSLLLKRFLLFCLNDTAQDDVDANDSPARLPAGRAPGQRPRDRCCSRRVLQSRATRLPSPVPNRLDMDQFRWLRSSATSSASTCSCGPSLRVMQFSSDGSPVCQVRT